MALDIKRQEPSGAVSRYRDPFAEMRAEMERVFDTFLGPSFFGRWRSPATSAEPGGLNTPSVDVRETDKEFVFEAELPGIEEKDVHLAVRDGILSLRGEKKSERDEKKDTYHLVERSYGSFERSFRLPDSADQDKIMANFDKGVLRIVVPKRANAVRAEKKISIGKG